MEENNINQTKKALGNQAEQSLIYVDNKTHKLMFITASGREVMSDEIDVQTIVKNLDDESIRITLIHSTCYSKNTFDCFLQDLQNSKIYKLLTSNGVIVYEEYSARIARYLIQKVEMFLKNNKMQFVHTRLGWNKDTDMSKGYFASRSINAPYQSYLLGDNDKNIGPNGDREIYDKMVQTEIIPNKSLHLPFVLAFIAPIVPLMYEESACPVLITNFAGKTSQGKSTSLSLIASVWGKGIIHSQKWSVAKTFSSTQNGFEATVNNNNGFPVLFDDYESASKTINFGKLIYTLAQGESKIRCDKVGNVKDTFSWRTFICLSGEASIFDKAGHNMGLKPRVVEFKNMKLTASKTNSINITSTIKNNYGFYGEEFVEKLMKKSKDDLKILYKQSEKLINDKVPPKDNVSDRIQTRLVLIRMTAILVRELMDLDIDIDYITNVLVENEITRQANLDVFQMAKEDIISYVNGHFPQFVRKDLKLQTTIIPSTKILGRIYSGKQGNCVALLPACFDAIMSKYNDKEAILEKWREEKFLIPDSDGKRFTKKVIITKSAKAPRCYVFVLTDNIDLTKKLTEEVENDISFENYENDDLLVLAKNVKKSDVVYFNGGEYIPLPDEMKKSEAVLKHNIDLHEYDDSKTQKIVFSEPKEFATDYSGDDEASIDEIFNENGLNNNSNDESEAK